MESFPDTAYWIALLLGGGLTLGVLIGYLEHTLKRTRSRQNLKNSIVDARDLL